MQTTHFPNIIKSYRYGTMLVLLLFACQSAVGQGNNGNYNYLDFQAKPYYFGITLGLNNSEFKPFYSNEFVLNDSINSAITPSGPGFNLGIVTNLKVGRYFDFRLLPTLAFAERKVTYTPTIMGATEREASLSSVFVELPFHVRYKSEPWNDLRVFVVGGVKYSFDVASESNARDNNNALKVSPNDFALEIGAGVQFFFPFFIFSPEIKYSHGLGNIQLYDSTLPQSAIFQQIHSRTFTISFHFEG